MTIYIFFFFKHVIKQNMCISEFKFFIAYNYEIKNKQIMLGIYTWVINNHCVISCV